MRLFLKILCLLLCITEIRTTRELRRVAFRNFTAELNLSEQEASEVPNVPQTNLVEAIDETSTGNAESAGYESEMEEDGDTYDAFVPVFQPNRNRRFAISFSPFPMNYMQVYRSNVIQSIMIHRFLGRSFRPFPRITFWDIERGREKGADEGGLTSEFIGLAMNELLDPRLNLFTFDEEFSTYCVNQKGDASDTDLEKYLVAGIVLGAALKKNVPLGVTFCPSIYLHILNLSIEDKYLERETSTVAKIIQLTYENDPEVFASYELTFEDEYGNALFEYGDFSTNDIPVEFEKANYFRELYFERVRERTLKINSELKSGFQLVMDHYEVIDMYTDHLAKNIRRQASFHSSLEPLPEADETDDRSDRQLVSSPSNVEADPGNTSDASSDDSDGLDVSTLIALLNISDQNDSRSGIRQEIEYLSSNSAGYTSGLSRKSDNEFQNKLDEITRDNYLKWLETTLRGKDEIDINDWKVNFAWEAENNFNESRKSIELVEWFFQILYEIPPEQVKHVFQFITGLKNLPIQGFKGLKFPIRLKLDYNPTKLNHLPVAHTCTFVLELFDCSGKEILKEKLLYAVYETAGIFDIA